jgi:diguanylate cyclase (GGDEF)-like protein
MNQMVEKLKALFQEQAERSEKLRAESYQDNLTGLANRRYFEMQLNARVSNPEKASSGYLLLLRVKDLAGLNQRLGGQHTDDLLIAVAEQLSRECAKYPETLNLVTRIRGGEFAVLAPGLLRAEALQLAQHLDSALASLHATGATDVAAVAFIGLAPFVYGDAPQAVLGLADQALAQAEGLGDSRWVCLDHAASATVGDDHHAWHSLLDQALKQQRFELYFQPVVASQDTALVLHYKVLSRLIDEQGQAIPAGRFLPWIERFGWSARLDRLMLERVLEQMADHEASLALNLSSATLANPQALGKVFDTLRAHAHFGPRLTLEIGEEQLPEQAELEELTRQLRELGFSLSLQHFGGRFSMIGNLARLGLAYLKIDGVYIRAIDQESDKRLFIEAIQRAAHSIDLPLIAERVETDGELAVIREMGIYGVQGQLFGEPKPWG